MSQRLGRYETIRQIASGGMAMVYLGRVSGEGGFERLVALKVMHPHIAAEPEFVAMFLDEARLAARIRHPNVVGTLDIQKTPEHMFLVMEYVEGAALNTIRRYLKKNRIRMPLPIALRIMLDTLDGLHAAHELTDEEGQALNLVHRDISPHNILVGTDGVARITDFGVARAEARISSTRGGQLKGKLPYMPPEQLLNEHIDRRADVYAAGVVLWELLVGRRLFNASNDGALVHDILRAEVIPPHERRQGVPDHISWVCMQALCRERDKRYASSAAFSDALEDAAMNAGVRPARAREVGQFVSGIREELGEEQGASLPFPSGPATSGSQISQIDSMPSMGSQPTHTEAVLNTASMQNTGRRRRLIAIGGVAAVTLVGGLALLTTGNGEDAESRPNSGAPSQPATTAETSAAHTPSAKSAATAGQPQPSAQLTAQPEASTASSTTKPPTPVRRPPSGTRPVSPTPNAAGTNYRPSGL